MTDMELKARHVVDVYDNYSEHPCKESSQVYLKSEADKVIAHHKYKRCLAMARWCRRNRLHASACGPVEKIDFWEKWRKRWLELAEKFKPNEE